MHTQRNAPATCGSESSRHPLDRGRGQRWSSARERFPNSFQNPARAIDREIRRKEKNPVSRAFRGADDGDRTRDPWLGKPV
jgi:hypothetical protein